MKTNRIIVTHRRRENRNSPLSHNSPLSRNGRSRHSHNGRNSRHSHNGRNSRNGRRSHSRNEARRAQRSSNISTQIKTEKFHK